MKKEADVEKHRRDLMIVDDPLAPVGRVQRGVYDPAGEVRVELNGQVLPVPLGPGYFEPPLPRVHRDPPPPTPEQRKAKRAERKAERQRRKAGRRGGR